MAFVVKFFRDQKNLYKRSLDGPCHYVIMNLIFNFNRKIEVSKLV